jgi:hypothetical protein
MMLHISIEDYQSGFGEAFRIVARKLNLSFRQDGEYIYLEGK